MKTDVAEILKANFKKQKRLRATDWALLSIPKKKAENFYSEENIKKVVKNWLQKRYNEKQTKFLMAKSILEEIFNEDGDEGLEPGEQRNSASLIAAAAAKDALAKARASLDNTTNDSIDDTPEPSEVRSDNTTTITEEPLELGEIRRR